MKLANIHCHMLYGVDDGATDIKEMRQMIDRSYGDGVRVICFTPHYDPGHFRYSLRLAIERYGEAVKYVSKYPDMRVYLGQELFLYHDTVDDLVTGKCLSLNKTRYVLVEFGYNDDKSVIFSKVTRLLTSGFIPVIAHVERYAAFRKDKSAVRELREMGARIQVNASSLLGRRGFAAKRFVLSLIKAGLTDVIADDSHDMKERIPCLGAAYEYVSRKFGTDTATLLFFKNPVDILHGK